MSGNSIHCAILSLEPLDTWGQTNFSLWCVHLLGWDSREVVSPATSRLREVRKMFAMPYFIGFNHWRILMYMHVVPAEGGSSIVFKTLEAV